MRRLRCHPMGDLLKMVCDMEHARAIPAEGLAVHEPEPRMGMTLFEGLEMSRFEREGL